MKIAVCIKAVPDPKYSDMIEIDQATKTIKRVGIPTIINKGDRHALEEALRIKEEIGGEVTVVSMGIPGVRKQLMEALAMGADRAFLVSDRKVAGADSLATSYTLSKVLEKTGPYDLILAGNESTDGATSHVPSQLGEWLSIGHGVDAMSVKVENESSVLMKKKVDSGFATYRLKLPCVIGCNARMNEVRFKNANEVIKAKFKPLTVFSAADFEDLDYNFVGLAGSPSQNGEMEFMKSDKECTMLSGNQNEVIESLYSLIVKEVRA